ncbi:MAG: right-handed parallel beta-helix repeat-containing protein [Candidatus Omnitrophota bacterium]
MRNRKGLALSVLSVFVSLTVVFAAGTASATDIDDGKTLLLSDKNFVGAHNAFETALAANPTGQVENFWHAVTVISGNEALKAKLRELDLLDEADMPLFFDAEGEFNYNMYEIENIIIDNDSELFSCDDSWTLSPETDSLNTYDTNCRVHASGSNTDTATWYINVPVEGEYEVFVWIPPAEGGTESAHYTVNHGLGSTEVYKNQKSYGQGAGWRSLGLYRFNFDESHSVVLSGDSSTGDVVADGLKLVYEGRVTDDSSEPDFYTSGDGWQEVSEVQHANRGNYHRAIAGEGVSATWMFNVPDAGEEYAIYVYMPHMEGEWENAGTVQYTVNGYDTVDVKYEGNDNHWYCIGIFQFESSAENSITLSSNETGNMICADAIEVSMCRPYPDLGEGQYIASGETGTTGILAEINTALGNLSVVTGAFSDTVTPLHCPALSEDLVLDYGDAKALESGLYFLRSNIKINAAYDMGDADIRQLTMGDGEFDIVLSILNDNEGLFKLRTDEGIDTAALLGDAKTALVNAIDSYMAASAAIRARTDGSNHLFRFYEPEDPEEEKEEILDVEEMVRDQMAGVKNNLVDHAANPFFTIPSLSEFFGEDAGTGIDIDVDLYEFFTNPKDLRDYLDAFIDNSDLIPDDFEYPTLDGILPGFRPADWNFLFGNGPEGRSPKVVWRGETPSVYLECTYADDPHKANITRFEIYRSTGNESLKSPANLITTIYYPSGDTACYTDNTLDPANNIYYYQLYTYYDLGDGRTAETYTSVGEAIISIYVDCNSVSATEDGTKANPFRNLGDAIKEETGDGTKVFIARGTYHESAMSIGMWNKDGLILEGGYEPTGWTRDIEANETIIDAEGRDDWSIIGLSNVSDVVIDGLTLKNGTAKEGTSGVSLWYSSSIIIRDCRIINCGQGVQVSNGTSVMIEGCYLEGRKADSTGYQGVSIYGPGISVEVIDSTITSFRYEGISAWNTDSSVLVAGCTIFQNGGNGIYGAAQFTIIGSRIAQNTTNGIYLNQNPYAQIMNNIIEDNEATGVYCENMQGLSIVNNTILNNNEGGGIYYTNVAGSEIKNNILVGNNGGWGNSGIYWGGSGAKGTISNNDSYGHTTADYRNCEPLPESNISQDPLFFDAAGGDYHLSQTSAGQVSDSPCLNTGSTSAEYIGLSGLTTRTDHVLDADTVDMGYHYQSPGYSGAKSDVVIAFGSEYGIWVRHNTPYFSFWSNLHILDPYSMTTGDIDGDSKDEVIIDFGSEYGVWACHEEGGWDPISDTSPELMVTGDVNGNGMDDVIIDFGSDCGIWVRYDDGRWSQVSDVSALNLCTGDIDNDAKDEMIIDFGADYGVWARHDDGVWNLISAVNAEWLTAGDFDGDSKDEVIIDFGSDYGIWAYHDDGSWDQINSVSPDSMATGDVNGNGKDDIIIDFGPVYGIWTWYDNGGWELMSPVDPESMVTADVDGNGRCDVVIDFGSDYGVWVHHDDGSWGFISNVTPEVMVTGKVL